ncbi:MAG: 1-deoxy-D-xylulose-5-phosphate reductoisomerase [Oscillospiraceae bacterium]|jgi:1-deoxy-D-xylulose-5-phosphate reductoisomerase|nr:1-deoxy-D-xylulose-5-phosphate reductoisomerase [Oscillospiraceae bacterium]
MSEDFKNFAIIDSAKNIVNTITDDNYEKTAVKKISILGSTGSIGTQALEICDDLNITPTVLTANTNIRTLEQQVRRYKPHIAAVYDNNAAAQLKIAIADTQTKVLCGKDGLLAAAEYDDTDMVLNSLVGMVGLEPTLKAANAKKNIALANKEALVAGGELVKEAIKANGVALLPVDSEHSAIFQCLQGANSKKEVKKLILTASGGPFLGKTTQQLKDVTPQQALKHPNWNMGAKITIDSATMMNKGLEIIEAYWLFGVKAEEIDVVVHPQSIIHSLVEYSDNAVIAQLGMPDMKIPIQYAITYPKRLPCSTPQLSLTDIGKLTFFEPDYETFLCMQACKQALVYGQAAQTAANGANEEANAAFRSGKISFLKIGELVYNAMQTQSNNNIASLQDVFECDEAARQYVKERL